MSRFSVQWAAVCGLWLAGYIPSLAQQSTLLKLPVCSIPDLTSQQKQQFQVQLETVSRLKKASRLPATSPITYVPIRPHIFRKSDGSGGFDLASLNYAMARTNYHFFTSGAGIQFYFCGTTPDYFDNDNAYTDFNTNQHGALLHDAVNALNQYYFNFSTTVTGLGYYPDDGLLFTRSYIGTAYYAIENQLDALSNYTMPHELGHNFFLFHTYGPGFYTDELVTRGAGANCSSAGDLICDTPADPYHMPNVTTDTYNFCPVYTGTARDANGDLYTPPFYNIMSYYPYTHGCTPFVFTPGQGIRMQEGLAIRQQHTSYSLDCPPADVAAPTNLSLTTTAETAVLTWQDNADNEMGYFIERSSTAQTNFVPIGGVGPNMTAFTDTTTLTGVSYYYRIRPSNTTTGSLSPVVGGVYTVKSGSWDDPTVWSFSQVPVGATVVRIRHTVTIPQSYEARANQLVYELSGEVKLENGARLVLGQ